MLSKPFCLFLLILPIVTLGAFTQPTHYVNNFVEQNAEGTWCYYPEGNNRNVEVSCTGRSAEFLSVLQVHINQTLSIAYYSAANVRYGGAEWPYDRTRGKIYLCMSGRAGDGRYKTICEDGQGDNDFGGLVNCALEVSQREVSDGCYEPIRQDTLVGDPDEVDHGEVDQDDGGLPGSLPGSALSNLTPSDTLGVLAFSVLPFVMVFLNAWIL